MINKFMLWFEYEKNAHTLTMKSFYSVPEENRKTKEFQKAVDLFAHIFKARMLWLFRMGFMQNPPENLFPQNVDLKEINSLTEETNSKWDEYFKNLDEKESQRIFEYKSTENLWYTNQVEEILTQLFGHSWYHRGQIAQLIRMAGGEPAETDFVYWVRKSIPSKD